MARINYKDNDRKAMAYDTRILEAAYGRGDALTGELKDIVDELSREFEQVFGIEDDKEQTKNALDNVRVNGHSQRFFESDFSDTRAARAYAMLKIRESVLYSENKETADRRNHVAIKKGGAWESIETHRSVEKPQKPEEISRFKQFMYRNFGGYKEEVEKHIRDTEQYNLARAEYKRNKETEAYNRENVARAQQEEVPERANTVRRSLQSLYEGENGLKKRLDAADKALHVNSREYKDFLKALEAVNEKWQDSNTPQNAKAMVAAYDKLEQACKTYLKKNASPRSSDMGQKRIEIVRDVLSAMKDERREVQTLWDVPERARSFEKLGEAASEARVVNLNGYQGEIKVIGAATSQRYVLELDDGKYVFTPNQKAKPKNSYEIVNSCLERSGLDNDFKAEYSKRCEGIGIAIDIMNIKDKETMVKYLDRKGISTGGNKSMWENFADNLVKKIDAVKNNINREREVRDFIAGYKDQQASDDGLEGRKKLANALDALVFFSKSTDIYNKKVGNGIEYMKHNNMPSFDARKAAGFLTQLKMELQRFAVAGIAKIEPDRRYALNERNIATSIMADLIDCPDVVARSRAAEANMTDKISKGIVMEYVDGVEGGSIAQKEQYGGTREMDVHVKNAGLKKKIADLQVLDSICGQIDRHINNIMFIQDQKTGAVTDCKGIDNDMAFGNKAISEDFNHSVRLGFIRVVDSHTAAALECIDKELIDYKLGDLLSNNERQALWQRVQVMQDWVRSDHVKKVSPEEWKDMEWKELNITSKNEKERNLFSRVFNGIMPAMKRDEYVRKDKDINRMIQEGRDFALRKENELKADQRRLASSAAENRTGTVRPADNVISGIQGNSGGRTQAVRLAPEAARELNNQGSIHL